MGLFDSGVTGSKPKPAERVPKKKKGSKASRGASNALSKVLAGFGVEYPDAPAPSPALLAFARGLGMNLSAAEDTRRQGIEQVEGRSADALDDLSRSSERGKKSLTADLVRRGVLTSGESNTRYARHAEDKADAMTGIARNKVEGISAIDTAFEQSKGAYRTQLLERVLGHETDTATREASSKAQEDLFKRQEEAAAEAWAREKASQDDYLKKMEELYKKFGA